MGEHRVAKVTISLPTSLLEFADVLARERSTTRSGVIAELLEQEEQARVEALMAQIQKNKIEVLPFPSIQEGQK